MTIDLTPGQLPGPLNKTLEDAINGKPDKPASYTSGDLVSFTSAGDLSDSSIAAASVSGVLTNLAKMPVTATISVGSGTNLRDVAITVKGQGNATLTTAVTVPVWVVTASGDDPSDTLAVLETDLTTCQVKSGTGIQLRNALVDGDVCAFDVRTAANGTVTITVGQSVGSASVFVAVGTLTGQVVSSKIDLTN